MSEKTSIDGSDVTDRDTGGASVTVAKGLIAVVRFKSMAGLIMIASDSLIGRLGLTGDDWTCSTTTGAGGGATTDCTTATDSTGADGDGGGGRSVVLVVEGVVATEVVEGEVVGGGILYCTLRTGWIGAATGSSGVTTGVTLASVTSGSVCCKKIRIICLSGLVAGEGDVGRLFTGGLTVVVLLVVTVVGAEVAGDDPSTGAL